MVRSNVLFSAAMVLAAGAGPASAQLLNGSFESGLAYPSGLSIFAAGTPTPWVATSFTPDLYDNTGVDGWGIGGIPLYDNMFKGLAACDGHRFLGFAASPTFGAEAFQQTTLPLVPGATYTLSTCIAADDLGKAIPFGGPYVGRGEVDVLLNGNLIGTFTQNTLSLTWESRSFSFVAPTATTAVFDFIAKLDPTAPAGTVASSYIGLDDMQLTRVPGPGSCALLGLAGLAVARRRR